MVVFMYVWCVYGVVPLSLLTDLALLHSGSVTSSDISTMAEMTSDQFALMLVEACNLPGIQGPIKSIVNSHRELFTNLLSAEVHRQTHPLKSSFTRPMQSRHLRRPSSCSRPDWMTSSSTAAGTVSRGLVYQRTWTMMIPTRPCWRSASLWKFIPSRTKGHRCVLQSWKTETGTAQTNLSEICHTSLPHVRVPVFYDKSVMKDVDPDPNSGHEIYTPFQK